jgi:signal transduction histidine kinase
MKNAPQLKNSLALRLLKVVFSIYLGITVVITLVQMVNEYLLEAHFVKNSLIISQSIFQESLGTSLWNFDHQQLSVTVEGILKQQTVVGIEIVDDQNKILIQKGQILNNNAMPVIIEQGIQKPLAYLSLFPHRFNLLHDKKPIGKVTLYSSNQVVIDKVKYNFLVIIINAIIKTIALWLLFIWAFKKYLTKQLDVFCLAMEKIDLDNQKTCFIHLETFDTYELSRIEYFFNALLKRLLEGRDKLNDLNKTLEHKVALRTQELSDKNLQLEKLNQEKNEFLSIAAHDLKNPLSAISSLTQLIKQLVKSGDNQEKLLNYVHFIDIIGLTH